MAESNQISRKRMRLSSSSASEILMTSKSQYQRNRSDGILPAGNGFNHSPSLTGKITSKVIRTYPRVTIKDLRLRRVFTPSTISSDWDFKSKGENQTKERPCDSLISNIDAEAEEFLKTTPPDPELLGSEEINGSAVRKSGKNLCSKPVLHPCSRAKIFKNPGSFSYKRLLPYLMQAADEHNPPNVNGQVAEDPKEEVSELMKAKCQLPETTTQSVDGVCNKHSAGSPLTNKKLACSRRKLFKTPGSVNYRRMLPYLKDNPCVLETVNHQKNTPLSVTSNVTRESETCTNEDKELVSCEPVSVSVSPERSDSDKEQETQVKHVISDTEKNLETPLNSLGSSRSSSEVVSSELNKIFVENLAGEEIMSGSEKTDAKNSAELLDASVVLGTPTPTSISPSKGILKRSVRGCRGICSCLNCSSFRLDAERAFEFSRNQLQDAQVMVLDLVGEISHLRGILEKYSSADHNESYISQAGEAAKRAREAADLAKSRLQLMNDDLQVHSRIPNEQRARVKFAHYVLEKTIHNLIPRSL